MARFIFSMQNILNMKEIQRAKRQYARKTPRRSTEFQRVIFVIRLEIRRNLWYNYFIGH